MFFQRRGVPKDPNYYRSIRWDILQLIPEKIETVLSVGCATGATEQVLKKQGKTVYGIEMHPDWAEEARLHLDAVYTGDVEKMAPPIPEDTLDCIVYADVLEHLKCPEKVLESHRKLLKPGGVIVVSVPNMRFWEIVFDLAICGDWQYTPAGVLDETHLRVFTPRSSVRFLNRSGFHILKTARTYRFFEHTQRFSRLATFFGHSFLKDFFTMQFLALARKTH